MIAWEGYLHKESSGDIKVNPHWRIDDIGNKTNDKTIQ
jgi:hypothetical protein